MMALFVWIEQSALSVWVRESPSLLAFPFILFLHTLGLALLAGISVALDLWLLMEPHALAESRPEGCFVRCGWGSPSTPYRASCC